MAKMPFHEQDFPYQRTLDALVTRREYLHLLTLTSLGLFLGTVGVVASGLRPSPQSYPELRIPESENLGEGEALNFEYPGAEDPAILIRLPGDRFVAYSQRCTHLSCAVYWDRMHAVLVCPCHEGFFNAETGLVIAGPPPRPLPMIDLRREGGAVYAIGVRV